MIEKFPSLRAGFWLVLMLSLLFDQRSSAQDSANPNAAGVIVLSHQMSDGKSLRVRFALRQASKIERQEALLDAQHNLDSGWWGTDQVPERIISSLEVKMGDEYLPLPRSAFSDLCGIRSAQIEARGKDFVLRIEGGDTGTGYVAELSFKDGYLVSRQMTHNEMGLEEKTSYFPIRDN